MTDAEIDILIEAAVLAPNHHVTEPWTFTVVQGEARERLGRRWAAIVQSQTAPDTVALAARIEQEARRLTRAPAVIIASVRTDPDPVVAAEDFAATAAAVQNMLLAAVGLELGAIWRTGPMAYSAEMKAVFGLAESDRIVGMVYVGRPAGDPKPRDQRRATIKRLS